eukprot:2145824-Pyramimonas_sp.AAC.1
MVQTWPMRIPTAAAALAICAQMVRQLCTSAPQVAQQFPRAGAVASARAPGQPAPTSGSQVVLTCLGPGHEVARELRDNGQARSKRASQKWLMSCLSASAS